MKSMRSIRVKAESAYSQKPQQRRRYKTAYTGTWLTCSSMLQVNAASSYRATGVE